MKFVLIYVTKVYVLIIDIPRTTYLYWMLKLRVHFVHKRGMCVGIGQSSKYGEHKLKCDRETWINIVIWCLVSQTFMAQNMNAWWVSSLMSQLLISHQRECELSCMETKMWLKERGWALECMGDCICPWSVYFMVNLPFFWSDYSQPKI